MEEFSFEQLKVWQKAVDFADKTISLTENLDSDRKHFRLIEQMESASSSIAQNIAEGKGRFSKKEYVRFLFFSRGSIYEVVTLLHIFKRRNWIDESVFTSLRKDAIEISKMLNGLINAISKTIK